MKRLALGLAAAALITPLVTGCSLASPLRTSQLYTPADGMALDIADSDVSIRNALIVADEDNENGAVVASVVNDGPNDENLILVFNGEQQEKIEVPGFSRVDISPEEDLSITVELRDVIPGLLTPVMVGLQSGNPMASTQLINMPIMAPDLERYATLTPSETTSSTTASTSTASPTTSGTPTATSTETVDDDEDAELQDTEATPSPTTSTTSAATESSD